MNIELITLLLIILFRIYFSITEVQAEKEKPKQNKALTIWQHLHYFLLHWGVGLLLVLQLLGFSLFPMPNQAVFLDVVGLLFVIVGTGICSLARKELGNNWVSVHEAHIKKGQVLITSGIYRYIRHPIYLGLPLIFLGAELVAQSYLFLFSIVLFYWMYLHAKKEDVMLTNHFGKAYTEYMRKTKLLVPFIF